MSTIRIQYANGTQLFLDGKNSPLLDPLPSFNPSVEDLEGLDREKNTGKGNSSSAGIPVPPVNVDQNVDNGGAIPAPASTGAPAAGSTPESAQEAPAEGQGDEKGSETPPTTTKEEKTEVEASAAAKEATATTKPTARKTTSK
ncbi:putative structural protein [Pseudomonas phage billy]|nr:putative structural protein [Pseudomonas phage billy]